MTSAADLLALQEIDLRRDARRAQIADMDSRMGETEALIAAREAAAAAGAEVERLRREQRTLDDEVQDLDARIKPLEEKLYGGSVRNPKELSDMQKELQSFQARRGKLDETGLALIEALEAANAAFATQRAEQERIEAEWQEEQEELVAAREYADRDYQNLEAERTRWAAGMDRSALTLYDALRAKKAGRAVARIDRTTCGGCRLTVPTQIVQRARAGTVLVQCPSCERILVGA